MVRPSGYLVRSDATTLLLDCGHGVFGQLRQRVAPEQLDAVFCSHLHPDHIGDLIAFAHYLRYHPHGRPDARPKLFIPAGERTRLWRLGELWDWPRLFEDSFFICELSDGEQERVGGVCAEGVRCAACACGTCSRHPQRSRAHDLQRGLRTQ